ncbi:hypothetical protein, partial [Burkholderia contaminans]|uniref:hypothetical protein n=1 Tax=Burkholderia contaminans TaxID=488447 RepID=UPI001C978A63
GGGGGGGGAGGAGGRGGGLCPPPPPPPAPPPGCTLTVVTGNPVGRRPPARDANDADSISWRTV